MKQLISILFLSVFINHAHANLVSMDWLSENDNLLIHDTQTGLYWLNVNVTNPGVDDEKALDFTFEAIKDRTNNPEDSLYGFRHASISEVEILFSNAGLSFTNDGQFHRVPEQLTETDNFLSLFGETIESTELRRLSGITASTCAELGLSGGCRSYNQNDQIISSVGMRPKIGDVSVDLVFDTVLNQGFKTLNTGHFLVSEVRPVPLPMAFFMFLSGLLGLFGYQLKNLKGIFQARLIRHC